MDLKTNYNFHVEPKKKIPPTRYWEYYLIRYLLSTAVGVISLFYLTSTDSLNLRSVVSSWNIAWTSSISSSFGAFIANNSIVIATTEPEKNNPVVGGTKRSISSLEQEQPSKGLAAYTFLLAAVFCGFTYSYLAGAPGLVLHSLRLDIGKSDFTIKGLSILIIIGICPFVVSALFNLSSGTDRKYGFPVIIALAMIQVCAILLRIKKGPANAIRIASERSENKNDEYVESYRHLRENATAFLVALYTLLFTFCLKNTPDNLMGIAVMVWIGPAGLVWLVSTTLEVSMGKPVK